MRLCVKVTRGDLQHFPGPGRVPSAQVILQRTDRHEKPLKLLSPHPCGPQRSIFYLTHMDQVVQWTEHEMATGVGGGAAGAICVATAVTVSSLGLLLSWMREKAAE